MRWSLAGWAGVDVDSPAYVLWVAMVKNAVTYHGFKPGLFALILSAAVFFPHSVDPSHRSQVDAQIGSAS